MINKPIYNISDKFWDEINEPFTQEMNLIVLNCRTLLVEGFNALPSEVSEFLEGFEYDVRKYAKNQLKTYFKDINTNLLRRFNSDFKEDNGKMRNWIMIEETAINDLWQKCKESMEGIFVHFRYIEIDFDCFKQQTPNESFATSEDSFAM